MTKTENPAWRKSSHSDANGACVEVARLEDGSRLVRHSLEPDSSVIRYTEAEWTAFLCGVRDGEFD